MGDVLSDQRGSRRPCPRNTPRSMRVGTRSARPRSRSGMLSSRRRFGVRRYQTAHGQTRSWFSPTATTSWRC